MRITKVFFIVVLCLLSTSILYGQVSFGQPEKINASWKFSLSDEKDAQQKEYNDSKWKTLNLPHDWSVQGQLSPTLASATGFLPGGIGWYRKTLNIPETKQGQKLYLYFEGVLLKRGILSYIKKVFYFAKIRTPFCFYCFIFILFSEILFSSKYLIHLLVLRYVSGHRLRV